jgi:hypothetical protein
MYYEIELDFGAPWPEVLAVWVNDGEKPMEKIKEAFAYKYPEYDIPAFDMEQFG